jgi:hypothetical protein
MLKITSEGRKAALDLRVLNPQAKDHPGSKINLAVDKVFQIWQDTQPNRSSQLVFCDLSTPSKLRRQFCVYDDLKAKLVERGIPAEEIAFIQDYDSDVEKLALFKEVKSGKKRVLLGSTQKMGAGMNVQERLVALHHLDAPWRPADVEQREGRILRQGNQNKTIQIYRYVTEGSFDAYMWQTLETKAKFIHQVMTGDTHIRHIEDIDSRALTYAVQTLHAPSLLLRSEDISEAARFAPARWPVPKRFQSLRSTPTTDTNMPLLLEPPFCLSSPRPR